MIGASHVLHDALEAAAEGQQPAEARDFAFGENANNLAVADRVARRVQRVNQIARSLRGRNRNRVQDRRANGFTTG